MKNIFHVFLLLFIAVLPYYGCKEKNENFKKYQDFRTTITSPRLDSVLIPPVLFKENRLVATEDLLISLNAFSDTFFHVFKLPECKYIGAFGIRGNGPDELSMVNIGSFRAYQDGLIAKDMKKVLVFGFSNKDTITNYNIVIRKRYKMPGELVPFNNMFLLNDSIICGDNRNYAENEIVYFNIKSKTIGSFMEYPDLYPYAPVNILWHLYQKHMAVSVDGSKIALLYYSFPMLRIYDVQDKLVTETSINAEFKQKDVKFTRKSIDGYMNLYSYYKDIVATKHYLYGLYQIASLVRKNENNFKRINFSKNQIHVFTWEGKPVLKIIVDERLKVFTITPNDEFIYFVKPDVENYIYRYSLKK